MFISFNILTAQFVLPCAARAENELEDPRCFNHFVPSLSPRITGAPVQREACTESKLRLSVRSLFNLRFLIY
jgi:hypothetical protein